jgi:hypothetical protein
MEGLSFAADGVAIVVVGGDFHTSHWFQIYSGVWWSAPFWHIQQTVHSLCMQEILLMFPTTAILK